MHKRCEELQIGKNPYMMMNASSAYCRMKLSTIECNEMRFCWKNTYEKNIVIVAYFSIDINRIYRMPIQRHVSYRLNT